MSAATSERSGTSTGSSAALRCAAMRLDRWWRALRSASFSRALMASGLFSSGASPRLALMMVSINFRPSKASRA
ncbi:Uncharacterised protein [Mycobacterium tuberculosis]|nr:Uncharacterised protein [Mycobacterium tuberculosis]